MTSDSPGVTLPSRAPAEWLEIAAIGTGAGIRPEDLPKLFRDFTQLETTRDQHHEGTGLGLAPTKRLVELHDGRIWAESATSAEGALALVEDGAPMLVIMDVRLPGMNGLEATRHLRSRYPRMPIGSSPRTTIFPRGPGPPPSEPARSSPNRPCTPIS